MEGPAGGEAAAAARPEAPGWVVGSTKSCWIADVITLLLAADALGRFPTAAACRRLHIITSSPAPGLPTLLCKADVAGGTGDVAFRVLDAMRSGQYASSSSGSWAAGGGASSSGAAAAQPGAAEAAAASGAAAAPTLPSVTVCDINAAMLAEGRKKAEGRGIGPESMQWVEGNAEALPFESGIFDSYTIAFGIRNVTDRAAALREAHRCGWGWLEWRGGRAGFGAWGSCGRRAVARCSGMQLNRLQVAPYAAQGHSSTAQGHD